MISNVVFILKWIVNIVADIRFMMAQKYLKVFKVLCVCCR